VKVIEVPATERSKARADWDAVFSALALGQTLLLSETSLGTIYHAAKRAGIKVHTSKREDGIVVWIWEK
jgi:hypothetical protein